MDKQTGGFASGNVYTFGFPDPDSSDRVDPSSFDLGGQTGGTDSDPTKDATGGSNAAGSTIDLDADEYDVVDDDSPDEN
jgi:UPF0716 protein FxsA